MKGDTILVLPIRAAFEAALKSSKNTQLVRVVRQRLNKRNNGIIFKKKWWNYKHHKQICSRWWRQTYWKPKSV